MASSINFIQSTRADENDYTEITSDNNPLVPFTSDPSTHRQCFNVTITDDEAIEEVETFIFSLIVVENTIPVTVRPDSSEVEIIDNDGMVTCIIDL